MFRPVLTVCLMATALSACDRSDALSETDIEAMHAVAANVQTEYDEALARSADILTPEDAVSAGIDLEATNKKGDLLGLCIDLGETCDSLTSACLSCRELSCSWACDSDRLNKACGAEALCWLTLFLPPVIVVPD